MKALIIAVGDELLSGKTVDANSAFLARRLAARGIVTEAHWTVGDAEEPIAAALSRAAAVAQLVLVSGGLGPTADDVTRQGLARAMGEALVLDEPSLAAITSFFTRRGRSMSEGNRVQAMIPRTAEPIPNDHGTAPGIAARLGGALVYCMPGVPEEMVLMFTERIAPRLPRGDRVIVERAIHAFGTGESDIGARIRDLMARGANPLVGITAAAGMITVRISAQAAGEEEARALLDAVAAEVRARLGTFLVGEGDDTLASVTGALLRARGRTLATAESCTGGLLGELVTAVPGSSDYYLGGVVAYADSVKTECLGVDAALCAAHGVVSEPVAGAMARGVRRRFNADWAVSTTGIAGPGGGSDEKPVGLVCFALEGPGVARTFRHVFPGTRDIVRRRAAFTALNTLRLALMEAAT